MQLVHQHSPVTRGFVQPPPSCSDDSGTASVANRPVSIVGAPEMHGPSRETRTRINFGRGLGFNRTARERFVQNQRKGEKGL